MKVSKGDLVYVPDVGPCTVVAHTADTGVITFEAPDGRVFDLQPKMLFEALIEQGLTGVRPGAE